MSSLLDLLIKLLTDPACCILGVCCDGADWTCAEYDSEEGQC